MKGPKFVVLELKDLIRSAIIAIVGLVVLVALIYMMVPKKADQPENTDTNDPYEFQEESTYRQIYLPGSYKSHIILHNRMIDVVVEVSATKIKNIHIENMTAEQALFYPLFTVVLDDMKAYIIQGGDMDFLPSSDIEMTTSILITAIESALDEASILPASAS